MTESKPRIGGFFAQCYDFKLTRPPSIIEPGARCAARGGRASTIQRTHMNKLPLQPRILRAYQAPGYLGMCRDVFNKTVRPYVREFPIGQQGVGFDRLELDQWADAYIAANSIDKQQSTDVLTRQKSAARQPGRNAQRQAVISDKNKTADPSAKLKEEFDRVLAMVKGKPKPTTPHRGKE